MELKLQIVRYNTVCSFLLIVPYGIETIKKYGKDKIVELLIVPYGIETFQPEFANIGFQPF